MKKTYEIHFREDAIKDIDRLDNRVKILVLKKINKLKINPDLGEHLGNKGGYDLTGYYKLYVDDKRIRIVYSKHKKELIIEVVAVGKRDKLFVYKSANKRK